MNGYLSHMASLAFNRVALVQPRLASRFEGSVGEAPAEDYREVVSRPLVNTPVPPPEAVPAVPVKARAPVTQGELTPPATPAHRTEESPVEARVTVQPVQPVATTHATSTGTRVEIQHLIREQVRDLPLLTPMAVSIPGRIPDAVKPENGRRGAAENTPNLPNQPVAHPDKPATMDKVPVPDIPTAPQDNRPLQIQTRISVPENRREPAAHHQPEMPVVSTPAASIQVSIGRIEIKATPASASPAAKPRPAPATLSLDDYLKQRKGDR